MANGITIDLSQFQPILKKFAELPQVLQEEIDGELEDASNNYAGLVKQAAPKDTGRLAGSANSIKSGVLSYEAFVQTNYAGYQEWGTGIYVSVPADLVDIAIKYKGKRSILGGVKPKHYFYSQRALVVPKLVDNLKRVLESTLNK